jgi:hypothetical protein
MKTELFYCRRYRIAGYDECNGFIIRARSVIEARQIAACDAGDEGAGAWMDESLSSCEKLTKAGNVGIILRSFLAG